MFVGFNDRPDQLRRIDLNVAWIIVLIVGDLARLIGWLTIFSTPYQANNGSFDGIMEQTHTHIHEMYNIFSCFKKFKIFEKLFHTNFGK